MEERKGFFTPEQEQKLDEIVKLNGFYEAMDGPAIKLVDNVLLDKIKEKLEKNSPGLLTTVYAVIDEIFENI